MKDLAKAVLYLDFIALTMIGIYYRREIYLWILTHTPLSIQQFITWVLTA